MRRSHSEQENADRLIDKTLKSDRAHLARGHDQKRTRRKAMAVLATGAGAASESSAATVGWVTKLLSAKGIVGTLGTITAVGGIGYGVATIQSSDGNNGSTQESVTPAAVRQVPAPNLEPPQHEEVSAATDDQHSPTVSAEAHVLPERERPRKVARDDESIEDASDERSVLPDNRERQPVPKLDVIDSARAKITIAPVELNRSNTKKSQP